MVGETEERDERHVHCEVGHGGQTETMSCSADSQPSSTRQRRRRGSYCPKLTVRRCKFLTILQMDDVGQKEGNTHWHFARS